MGSDVGAETDSLVRILPKKNGFQSKKSWDVEVISGLSIIPGVSPRPNETDVRPFSLFNIHNTGFRFLSLSLSA